MDGIKTPIRLFIRKLAIGLNRVSGGKVTPNSITFISLAMHLPIAVFIAYGKTEIAAVLLIIFGLFDTLDGELARLQNRATPAGMFLDSATDRIKEVILYCGITALFLKTEGNLAILAAVAALGISLIISYANAWGEAALATKQAAGHHVNKSLRTGLLGLEVRMALIVVGLVFNLLVATIFVIVILGAQTLWQRLISTYRRLL